MASRTCSWTNKLSEIYIFILDYIYIYRSYPILSGCPGPPWMVQVVHHQYVHRCSSFQELLPCWRHWISKVSTLWPRRENKPLPSNYTSSRSRKQKAWHLLVPPSFHLGKLNEKRHVERWEKERLPTRLPKFPSCWDSRGWLNWDFQYMVQTFVHPEGLGLLSGKIRLGRLPGLK